MIAMRTSALLGGPSAVGGIQSSWSSRGELEEGRLRAVRGELHDREPAGAQHLLVDGLHERLGGRGRLDHADVALLARAVE